MPWILVSRISCVDSELGIEKITATIPGRPPLHERSISAPGQKTWQRNVFGDSFTVGISGPALDESAEINSADGMPDSKDVRPRRRSGSPKGPLSPRSLAPLVIPTNMSSAAQRTLNRADSPTDAPPNVPPKSARMLEDKISPLSRTPYTPLSGSTYTPLTGSTTNLSMTTAATPISAATEGRISPFPSGPSTRGTSPKGHSRGQSDAGGDRPSYSRMGHRRELSEASIMDRGRPKKRADGSPIKLKQSIKPSQLAAEQKAFETLPEGIKAIDAQSRLEQTAIDALREQAIGQAAKFEVLNMRDVESLSRVCPLPNLHCAK